MYEILTTIWEFIKPFLKWLLDALPTILGGFIGFCFLSKPQREDFRFRLFEKRLKNYDEIKMFLVELKDNPDRFDGTRYNKFQQLTKDTPLLFGKEIAECCDQISHCINQLDHAVLFNQGNKKLIEDFKKLTNDFSSLVLPYIDFSDYNHNGKRKKVKKRCSSSAHIIDSVNNGTLHTTPQEIPTPSRDDDKTTLTINENNQEILNEIPEIQDKKIRPRKKRGG